MLGITWGGALLGSRSRCSGVAPRAGCPRPIYIALGWAPVFFFGDFVTGAMGYGEAIGTAVIALVVVGGGLYTLGGLVYGTAVARPAGRAGSASTRCSTR